MALICAAISEKTMDKVISTANKIDCDIVELRLDHLNGLNDLSKISKIKKKKIATCMPKWEGGRFHGSEDERIGLLEEALKHVDYVSIEQKTKKPLMDRIVRSAKKAKVKLIISHHDFEKTPKLPQILKTLRKQKALGADIAKIAYMPKDRLDVLNVMMAQVKADIGIPVIALSMGEFGKISRVACPALGGYLSFASARQGKQTADGQLTVSQMHMIKRILW